MRFTVDGVSHEFDEASITFAEGRALERVTGHAFTTLEEHSGELPVIQGFIWVALKRSDPTLKFSDLDDRAITDFAFEEETADESSPTEGGGESATDAPSTFSD